MTWHASVICDIVRVGTSVPVKAVQGYTPAFTNVHVASKTGVLKLQQTTKFKLLYLTEE